MEPERFRFEFRPGGHAKMNQRPEMFEELGQWFATQFGELASGRLSL
jgi:hypothetical protein